jgi:diguanylate cyclase (GGDEF)-like protein
VTAPAEELTRLRHLVARGRPSDAVSLADQVLRGSLDPAGRADIALLRLAALLNMGRHSEYPGALDEATEAVHASPEPERYGQLYTLAALIAGLDDSIEASVTYLVRSSRALGSVQRVDRAIACAWHDLALAYSYVGLHGYALSAIERARRMAAGTGLPEADFVVPSIRVRLAVWHDQHGDTDACVRVLRDVVADLTWHEGAYAEGRAGIRPSSAGAYGYAAARLAALGDPVALAGARGLLARATSSQGGRDMRTLGEVCLLIAAGAAGEAIKRLETAKVAPRTLGSAEPERLRALAHLRAGRRDAAHAADRRVFRIASAQVERLRERYVEAVAAQIDQQDVQRRVAVHGPASPADPLTGLVTRHDLEQQVAAVLAAGEPAMLATCELDGLAEVNEAHGRLSGDLVLQRVATVLARVMRRGDLVARYGGSRFAVLLPGAGPDEARDVAVRIEAAVGAEEWGSLVPGTPVAARVRWSAACASLDPARAATA